MKRTLALLGTMAVLAGCKSEDPSFRLSDIPDTESGIGQDGGTTSPDWPWNRYFVTEFDTRSR